MKEQFQVMKKIERIHYKKVISNNKKNRIKIQVIN